MAADRRRGAITSVDVARRAGVSQSAVSLVFAGKADGRVGQATRDAIIVAARELGYQPNRAARALRCDQTRLVALAVPDVTNPYFAAALKGAEQEARQHGYAAMLTSVGRQGEQDWRATILDLLTARAVDGALLFAPPPVELQSALRGKAVVVDASSQVLPSLHLGVEEGARVATNHLLALGHTRIGHLAAAVDVETFQWRARGYQSALAEAGIALNPAYERRTPFELADARRVARALLSGDDRPTAVLCDSDMLAAGVFKAAHDLDLVIPRDVSVVGFDDSMIASLLEPELTTVAIPTAAIAARAFRMLLAVLEQRPMLEETSVSLDLVVRSSSTPPAR